MSSGNLFDDVDESEDIFGGGSSGKQSKVSDDLFGDLEQTELFDNKTQSAESHVGRSRTGGFIEQPSLNGHKKDATNGDEFVLISRDDVPSPQEAEELAKKADSNKDEIDNPAKTTADDDIVYNNGLSYEERARLRREKRQAKVSQTTIPSKPNHPQDRNRRSVSPSPSPGVEEGKEKTKRTSIVISVHSRSSTPTSSRTSSRIGSPPPSVEDTPEHKMEKTEDASAQIHDLTNQLQREHAEKESLAYDNTQLRKQLDELRAKVNNLEEAIKKKDEEYTEAIKTKDEEFERAMTIKDAEFEEAIKKKDTEFEEALKKKDMEFEEAIEKKDNEIEELRASKGSKKVSPVLKKSNARPSSADSAKTRVRPGVDKSRPITSVKDSVKKFSVAGSAGSPEIKRVVHPRKEKTKTEGEVGAKAEEGGKAKEGGERASSAKGDKPVPSSKKPTKPPAVKKTEPKKPATTKPTHTSAKHPPAAKPPMEKPLDVSPPSSANDIKTEDKVLRVETTPPPVEPDNKVVEATETVDTKVDEPEEIDDDPSTRAQRVISLFEGRNSKVEAETPPWKRHLKSREQSREGSSEPVDSKKPAKDVDTKPNKATTRPQTRSQSNASDVASAPKDEVKPTHPPVEPVKQAPVEPVKPSPVETPEECTDGIVDANESVVLREKPMKKVTSANDIVTPAKRLIAESNTAKRSSWAGNKREECATCGKVVYAMERLEADKVVYHKTCFKCTVCKKTLTTGTYAALQGKTYCKVHFKQLFKMKGNYDEGFGREQHKTKWSKKTSVTDAPEQS